MQNCVCECLHSGDTQFYMANGVLNSYISFAYYRKKWYSTLYERKHKRLSIRPEMRILMDYNQNQEQYNDWDQNPPQEDLRFRGFSIASMVCGICSLVLCCTGILSIPAGALGILFALLTRKRGQRMNNMCVAGIWLSCVGLALGIFITVSSIVTVFTDPSYLNMLDQMYREMYGVGIDEFWQSYL